MSTLKDWRQGLSQAWESLAEGWQHLKERATGAVTPFRAQPSESPRDESGRPIPLMAWGYLGVDVLDDDQQLVVRLEAPGMRKEDFDIQVEDDVLVIRGEKRLEREEQQARYRVIQCAYGSFTRVVPLPAPVQADGAQAAYRDGVLRVTLPKAEMARVRRISVQAG